MNKNLILAVFCLIISAMTFAQVPQKMSYQAVVRGSDNSLVTSSEISVRISLLQGSADGEAVYTETHSATTNANGLLTIEIGDGTVLPIEVKSGKDYEYHHALANILDKVEYNLNKAIILCNDNVSVDGKKTYLPIYMATFIRRKQEIPGIYKLDI